MILRTHSLFSLHFEDGSHKDVGIGPFPDKEKALWQLNAINAPELNIGPFDIEDAENPGFEPIYFRLIERLNGHEIGRHALITKTQPHSLL